MLVFFFIVYKKEHVGFLKLNIDKPLPGGDVNALELERIYLTKQASGNGIGREVVQFTIDIAKQENKRTVWLKVMDSSMGPIAFYKKCGFEICDTYQLPFKQLKEPLRGMYIMRRTVM